MTEGPHLRRLTQVLEAWGAPVLPVLSAIEVSGTSSLFLAASVLSRRLELLLPFTAEGLAAIAPSVVAPPLPPRSLLKVTVDGEHLGAALLVLGAVDVGAAVDEVAPLGTREAWRPLVVALPALAGGAVASRTRFLTERRGAVTVAYPPQLPDDAARLIGGVAALAAHLGIAPATLARWTTTHAGFKPGVAMSIITECGPAGPRPSLGILYGATDWDAAVQLSSGLVDLPAARQAAARLGELAGMLEVDQLRGLEVTLGATGDPDVAVWIVPRPT